jgi:hypothetical protein
MSKLTLDLDAVKVESCEMAAKESFEVEMLPKTQPVSYPCCYTVYMA